MKSNNCQENILAASAQAAPTSFPQYPLLTGGEAIPPNIMLILDDSGSMEAVHMPTDRYSLSDLVRDRSYINNTLYYNPDRDYKPWRKASVDLDDRFGNANFRSVSSSTTSVSNGGFDLRDQAESYFYIPKAGVSNPGTNSSNYDKYRIASSSSANSYNGGVVQKQVSRTDVILSGTVSLGNRVPPVSRFLSMVWIL
jgi:type IV pilus assembly protein PilY1